MKPLQPAAILVLLYSLEMQTGHTHIYSKADVSSNTLIKCSCNEVSGVVLYTGRILGKNNREIKSTADSILVKSTNAWNTKITYPLHAYQ